MKKFLSLISMALMAFAMTGCSLTSTEESSESSSSPTFMIVWIVLIVAMMYFMIIRPNKKQKKEQEDLFGSMAIGDTVLTTSGFYGTIIDLTDDTVIVEFGNNKNCRVPMMKQAIAQIEKPDYANNSGAATSAAPAAPAKESKPEKRSFFGRKKDKAEAPAGEKAEEAKAEAPDEAPAETNAKAPADASADEKAEDIKSKLI